MPLTVSIFLRYLYQEKGVKGKELLRRFPQFSRATVYRHAKRKICDIDIDLRRYNEGRPRVVFARDKRTIVRHVKQLRITVGAFTMKRVRNDAGMEGISDRTMRRALNELGYYYLQAGKKGCSPTRT